MFTPTNKDLYKNLHREEDPHDLRLSHHVTRYEGLFDSFLDELKENDVVLLGYPDDRGVERNGGRTGAFAGPDQIRKYLLRFTPSYQNKGLPRVWDIGNLKTWSQDLLLAHEEARVCVRKIRRKGARIISLGGGHDWAYPDFIDLGEDSPTKARVINVDAHLDVRPNPTDTPREGHSGTPFRRILENSQKSQVPEIMAIGLQESCNARSHVEWAHSRRMTTLFLDELPENIERRWPFVVERLQIGEEQVRYGLSIDLDVFPQFISPGVSAPQVLGIDPQLVYKMIQTLGPKIRHLGIYEYNPSFDEDGRSARLAAHLVYSYLMTLQP